MTSWKLPCRKHNGEIIGKSTMEVVPAVQVFAYLQGNCVSHLGPFGLGELLVSKNLTVTNDFLHKTWLSPPCSDP